MRSIVCGDIHSKEKDILNRIDVVLEFTDAGNVVLCGDLCDEYNLSDRMTLSGLKCLLEWKREKTKAGLGVVTLCGNHDLDLLLDGRHFPFFCSSFTLQACKILESLDLRAAASVEGFLISHAGLTESWALEYVPDVNDAKSACKSINAMFDSGDLTELIHLGECGPGRGGKGFPGPLWADKSELEAEPLVCVKQVVGHTPVRTCTKKVVGTSEVWFVDTFSRTRKAKAYGDGSMLLIEEDGEASVITDELMQSMGLEPWRSVAARIGIVENEPPRTEEYNDDVFLE